MGHRHVLALGRVAGPRSSFPDTTRLDVVAVRRSDGKYLAIQCKSRQLDEYGHGSTISNIEVAKFAAASSGAFWTECWIVSNGSNPLASGAQQASATQEECNTANRIQTAKSVCKPSHAWRVNIRSSQKVLNILGSQGRWA